MKTELPKYRHNTTLKEGKDLLTLNPVKNNPCVTATKNHYPKTTQSIIDLHLMGKSNEEIADRLYTSSKTKTFSDYTNEGLITKTVKSDGFLAFIKEVIKVILEMNKKNKV